MASTGFIAMGTAANAGTGQSWNGLTDCLTDGGNYTYSVVNDQLTKELWLTNASLSGLIPSGATIDGIEIKYGCWRSVSGMRLIEQRVKLVINGSIVGNNKASATTWGTTKAARTLGGATDKWGLTPSRADIIASNSGFMIEVLETQAISGQARVDGVWINVYYTVGGSSITATGHPAMGAMVVDAGSMTVKRHASGTLIMGHMTIDGNGAREIPAFGVLHMGPIGFVGGATLGSNVTGSIDLGGMFLTSLAGAESHDGPGEITLGAMELNGSADFDPNNPVGNIIMAPMVVDSFAFRAWFGSGDITLAPMEVTNTTVIVDTEAGITLGSMIVNATGKRIDVRSDGVLDLGIMRVASEVKRYIDSDASILTPPLSVRGDGSFTKDWTVSGSITLGGMGVAGLVTFNTLIDASATITLSPAMVAGQAENFTIIEIGSTVSLIMAPMEVAAVVAINQLTSGSGAINLGAMAVEAEALSARIVDGDIDLAAMVVSATAHIKEYANGTLILGSMGLSGSTVIGKVANGSITLAPMMVEAAGSSSIVGNAIINLGPMGVEASGFRDSNAFGALSLGAMTVAGEVIKSVIASSHITLGAMVVRARGNFGTVTGKQFYRVVGFTFTQGGRYKKVDLEAVEMPVERNQ